MTTKAIETIGAVSCLDIYTLDEFKRRLKITPSAMRAMRKSGLKVAKVGKRVFVPGISFWLEVLRQIDIQEEAKNESQSRKGWSLFGPSLDLPENWEGETEICPDEGPTFG